MTTMTPREIVEELDQYIIGQKDAKKSVAIALRNRWRRMQVGEALRVEIVPKNILMIGPTGVGKTEIARRLAKLAGAPFIKVEATKFTEVGYVGRDVESIIRDLADVAVKDARQSEVEKVQYRAEEAAEERILDALLPKPRDTFANEPAIDSAPPSKTREVFKTRLRAGELDDKTIALELSVCPTEMEIMAPPGMEEMTNQLQGMFKNMATQRTKTRKIRVKEAMKVLKEEEAIKLVNEEDLKATAIDNVEQNGIVFIDEIDKIAKSSEQRAGDVSREGVQRDLLPLVEGSTVSTKYGMIKTDHILFIGSGAFHVNKPSDLIPELQGRFPIRVELSALTADDFERILTEPSASLTEQYQALMSTEGVTLDFAASAIRYIAEAAWQVNEQTENIGARRLQTVMEKMLERISFEATDRGGETINIDEAYVKKHLAAFVKDEDLSHYIL